MRIFLKAKHWQLFLMYIGPFIAQNLLGHGDDSGARFDEDFVIVFLLFCISTIIFLGWIWSVAITLMPMDRGKELLVFQIAYFWIVLYIIVCISLIVSDFDNFRILLIPHLLTIVATFYCILVAARRIKIIEHSSQASPGDYMGYFFMIVFFPFGIWWLQPRINKIVAAHG